MSRPVRVIASRFEDLVSLGLRRLVEADPSLELVSDDVPFERLEAEIGRQEPDVVVVNFGSLPSPVTVHHLHEAHPGTRLVILANRPSAAECNQMLAFGATACLSKETQGRDVVNAIHLSSRGMRVLPRSAAPGATSKPRRGSELLTAREAEVLELLQEGMTNPQIAAALSIGIETVRTHARSIFRKLGITSRRELARLSRPSG